MTTIVLNKGFNTLVDEALYEQLSIFKWYVHVHKERPYAVRHEMIDGRQHHIFLHRQVLGLLPKDGKRVTFVDGNTLNNRLANLCTSQNSLTEKFCPHCQTLLPKTKEHFYRLGARKRWSYLCIKCHNKDRNVRQRHKPNYNALKNGNKRSRYAELKLQIIEAYGGKCNCCSESIVPFLTIDHVNGDGEKERARGFQGIKLFRHIVQENYPDKYQLLCYNCNCAKGILGVCPHKQP